MLYDVEASTFCLHNRLTDAGKVVSPTHRPLGTSPGRFLVLIAVKRLSRPQGHNAAGRIR
jgi:hypothetical protein